jgi:hypothetical protein
MKRLLLFLLCQGSLDGFSQNICPVHHMPNCKSLHLPAGTEVLNKPDTLASHLLISHRPPSFGHSIEGYCIVVNGDCIGSHLVYRSTRSWLFGRRKWSFIKVEPNSYDVWRCIRKEGL